MEVNRDANSSGLDFSLLPEFGILNNYKFYDNQNGRFINKNNENKIIENSIFHVRYRNEIEDYLKSEKINRQPVIEKLYKGYNKIYFNINITNKGVLFIKDSYSKFWKAKINSVSTKVYPAFEVFKAVLIPEGTSLIELEYDPKIMKYLMLLAYSSILMTIFLIIKDLNLFNFKNFLKLKNYFF